MQSLTDWPVDAFVADLKDVEHQTVVWIDGGVIGRITATGDFDDPEVDAVVFPLTTVTRVQVKPRYAENNARSLVTRTMTIDFASGESITVDAGKNREGADAFIAAVLSRLAYPHAMDL